MKMKSKISKYFYIKVPDDFNFWRTVCSHGWCLLQPFSADKENRTLNRLTELSTGKLVYVKISANQYNRLRINYETKSELQKSEKNELTAQIRSILRIEENFTEFYKIAKKNKQFQWVHKAKAGRLLRSPTVFEDIVKLICTTNCSWALTEVMVNNLTSKLGRKLTMSDKDKKDVAVFSFPTPEAIAATSEKFLRSKIRAGYRAPYILELARNVYNGGIDLESWRNDKFRTAELYKMVKSIKGAGPYAAGNMLKLLGHYDYLAIDSWCRVRYYKIHKDGKKASDKAMEKFYEHYGKWRGLFFWMDLTKHWYDYDFPF